MNNTTIVGQSGLIVSTVSAATQASVSDDTQFYANLCVAIIGVVISAVVAVAGFYLKWKEYKLTTGTILDITELSDTQVSVAKKFIEDLKNGYPNQETTNATSRRASP